MAITPACWMPFSTVMRSGGVSSTPYTRLAGLFIARETTPRSLGRRRSGRKVRGALLLCTEDREDLLEGAYLEQAPHIPDDTPQGERAARAFAFLRGDEERPEARAADVGDLPEVEDHAAAAGAGELDEASLQVVRGRAVDAALDR